MFLRGGDACNQSVGSSIEVYETRCGPTRNIYVARFVYPLSTQKCPDRGDARWRTQKNARDQGKGKDDTQTSNR